MDGYEHFKCLSWSMALTTRDILTRGYESRSIGSRYGVIGRSTISIDTI